MHLAKKVYFVSRYGTKLEVDEALIVAMEPGEEDVPLCYLSAKDGFLDIKYPKEIPDDASALPGG